jgi:hypothetical protein
MTRVALLFAAALTLGSCSWFTSHVDPVIPAVVTCSGATIPAATVRQVWNDLKAKNYGDLVTNVLPLLADGWNDLTCIIDAVDAQDPQLQEAGAEFKRQHAVEIRNSRPVSLRSPGDPTPKTGPTLDKIPQATSEAATFRPGGEVPGGLGKYSYPGQNVGAELAACYRDCGDNAHGALAPPGGCECWRKVGSTWRWVALRDAPGAGMVATR